MDPQITRIITMDPWRCLANSGAKHDSAMH
jgi:hypothetical protein